MNEIGVILISHGYFAKYAMDSAEMIIGKQDNYKVISVTDDKDLEDVIKELEDSYNALSKGREVIVLTDIFGGTPCNAASRLILSGKKVTAYTGFNLPVLLELLLNRDKPLSEVKLDLEKVHNETFISISDRVLNKLNEDEIVL
ncbi:MULTISPECIES: PTS sugar transporter subunit IIA [unclassified Clostridium]|jgi:PTS system fructose subfamily IIA component|uniref:PTS sugar transporter subunit IIA n=1 Tax=unclassified Clostridium TaxID=2614128 RepID=UPI0025BB4152|nr:PTS sugar transporter subunit IIA [Clostridium sp.]MDY6226580.1 PTS sugar transporter subunit IIA [Clostridium sp.]